MLCPALALGFSGKVQAKNESIDKVGTVTIQYVDFHASGDDTKPIEGAMFSFYPIDTKKGEMQSAPYVTLKTDEKGILTAKLPEGEYKVRQEANEVRYRTSDFRITIPMKNDQGVLTDEIEAIPKAEPVTESEVSGNVATPTPSLKASVTPTAVSGHQGHAPLPKSSEPLKKKAITKSTKTNKVKTGDNGLYPAAAAAIVSAAGLGTAMLIGRKRQQKGDDQS